MLLVSTYYRFLVFILYSLTAHGAIRFANYYADHMVLQRAPQRAIVWGYTNTSDAPITLIMNDKAYRAILINGSIWSVTLDAQTDEGPFQVKVTQPLANGTLETLTLNDVLFGDIWVCSGQSNMQFPAYEMFNASIEIENAGKYPKVRLLSVGEAISYTPQEELMRVGMQWSVASNTTISNPHVSAVCWLYGRMIHEGLDGRPIGLIHSSWGGTCIEDWIPPEVLKECGVTRSNERFIQRTHAFSFQDNPVLNSSVLYNAMIYPLTRMVVKGAIWYQGESNINYNRDAYTCTFSKMIETWRNVWHTRTNSTSDPTFPFGFVQLATADPSGKTVGGFPWIRWHQTFDVGYVPNDKVPNVFMAVALDLRDDEHEVHPHDKLDVGYRLSRSGLAVAYGYKDITYLGPIIADVSVASDSSKVNITYSNVASPTIELRNPNGFEVCCSGTQVCNATDSAWLPAPASRIEGTLLSISLAVPSQCVSKPITGLRYLWKETPCLFKQAGVYNSEDPNLPAPPYIHHF